MKDSVEKDEIVLDTSGTECPIPVLRARRLASQLKDGVIVRVITTDPLAKADFQHYCSQSKYEFLSFRKHNEKFIIRYRFKSS